MSSSPSQILTSNFDRHHEILYGVLLKFKKHNLVKEFRIRKKMTLLEYGSGFPLYLFFMYHDFEFNKITCVDVDSLTNILKQGVNAFNKEKKAIPIKDENVISMYDLYLQFISINTVHKSTIRRRREPMNESRFNKIFDFRFSTYAEAFANINKDKFDAIILSNFLHLQHYPRPILQKAISQLKKDGLIYIKVNHSLNDDAIRKNHFLFEESEFISFFKNFETIFYEPNSNYPENSNLKSRIYVGIKRA